jgi:Na+-transporting NADH:ubiquinone oxidoreductase subunit NqrE
MNDCFLRAVFLKIAEIAQFLGLLCSTVEVMYQFLTKMGLGHVSVDLFNKLIWSPWFLSSYGPGEFM